MRSFAGKNTMKLRSFRSEIKATYEISPKLVKASLSCLLSISGERSPTKTWKCPDYIIYLIK